QLAARLSIIGAQRRVGAEVGRRPPRRQTLSLHRGDPCRVRRRSSGRRVMRCNDSQGYPTTIRMAFRSIANGEKLFGGRHWRRPAQFWGRLWTPPGGESERVVQTGAWGLGERADQSQVQSSATSRKPAPLNQSIFR